MRDNSDTGPAEIAIARSENHENPAVKDSNQSIASQLLRKDRASSSLAVPISKRRRPWKEPRSTPTSALKNVAGLRLSWERKQALRDQRKALLAVVKAAKEEDQAARDAERQRRYEKRKRKEENELRSAKKVVITNPKKLAKMSKKQFLSYVHKK